MNKTLSTFRQNLQKRRQAGKGKVKGAGQVQFLFQRLTEGERSEMYSRELTHTTRQGLTSFVNYSTLQRTRTISGNILIKDAQKKVISESVFAEVKPEHGARYFFLSDSLTKPSFREEGLQRQVIQELSELAKRVGVKSIRLNVLKTNLRAIEARKRIGFKPVSTTNPTLDAQKPEMMMELSIPSKD
ncbi:MAG: GNAT family N-acetyltransferase [archaeon]|jgi:ribosomal protein S18 acetylase RimI-like enzyme